eukprot:6250837-Lingulodinium_polyedra.AAC.1
MVEGAARARAKRARGPANAGARRSRGALRRRLGGFLPPAGLQGCAGLEGPSHSGRYVQYRSRRGL